VRKPRARVAPDDNAGHMLPSNPLWRAIEAFDRELRGLEQEVRVLAEWYVSRRGDSPSRRDDAIPPTDRPSQ
jgi:hypothetical protein